MKRSLLALMLSLCLVCTGCGGTNASPQAPGGNTILDGSGAALPLPEQPEEVTIASVYAVSVPFLVALNLSERVVAINVKSTFWTDAVPSLAEAGSVGRGTVDLEALAELSPGVLIHRANENATVEAVTGKLNIPVFCIKVESMEDIHATLDSMGRYFGAEERAAEVIAWLDGKFAMIGEIVAKIPEEERVTALVMGGELGRVAAGDMLQSWMIAQAGGIPVAAEVSDHHNWASVGVETIFSWNPDVLFLTSSTVLEYTPDTLRNDPTWSGMRAVEQERIYQMPAKIDSWDLPGIGCALGTMYMLHKMYPDYFSADQLEQEIAEYYTFLFGKSFDAAYLGYHLGD